MFHLPTQFGVVVRMSAVVAALSTSAGASAAIIYSDNFDSYATTASALNFVAFNAPLALSGGSVDAVKSGDFGIVCAGGSGACIDLDGSSNASGTLTWTFALGAGSYVFSIDISGNQRGGTDNFALNFVPSVGANYTGTISVTNGSLASTSPFGTRTGAFTLSSAMTVVVNLSTTGNDNIGVIVDNARLESNSVQPVPEPASLALLGLGVAGLALARRRRR